jgi:D-alanine-D-alanine ligase
MTDKKKILICFNEPASIYDNYLGKDVNSGTDKVDLSEKDFLNQISFLKTILRKKYSKVETLAFNKNIFLMIDSIRSFNPDLIFNFVESVEGISNYESHVAGIFDLLGFNYTGNNSITLSNCLLKSRTKQILSSHQINTPMFTIAPLNEIPTRKNFRLKFPVISKLIKEDASIGISEFSVSLNYDALKLRLKYLFKNFRQDVIIEEYIEGRELNVAILGGKLLPISEIRFDGLPDGLPKIVTYEAKWAPDSIYYNYTVPKVPAKITKSLKEKVYSLAFSSYEALNCRDYARVDIRISKHNEPYVIEVNPNPDISPDSGFARSASAAGISYDKLIYTISTFGLMRKPYDTAFIN